MRTFITSLSFVLFASLGLGACAVDDAEPGAPTAEVAGQTSELSTTAPAEDVTPAAPVAEDATCGDGEKYCPITDLCIPQHMICRSPCRSGFHWCGDYCERNGHLCM